MTNTVKILIVVLGVLVACVVFYFGFTTDGRAAWNTWWHKIREADDDTNYETLKRVEDTCRSMVASYTSDALVYQQYKDSTDEDEKDWAEQAKMRANKTAASYNEYILNNSYVWKGNVPGDIRKSLEYILD